MIQVIIFYNFVQVQLWKMHIENEIRYKQQQMYSMHNIFFKIIREIWQLYICIYKTKQIYYQYYFPILLTKNNVHMSHWEFSGKYTNTVS